MIRGEVIGDKAVSNMLLRIPISLRGEMTIAIRRIVAKLTANVKADKLSGQVLNVKSGRLRRSINSKVEGPDTDMISGVVGTNVVYARPHEMGFKGQESVRAHMRMMKIAWGKPVKNPREINVGAHSRNVDFPMKSFLRSALREMEEVIKAEFERAVERAVIK